ncbi:MAG: hypothetical protein ACYSPJ_03360, partial [Planctomycetota bacterium]
RHHPEKFKENRQFHGSNHNEHVEPLIQTMNNAKPSHPMYFVGQEERTVLLGINQNRKPHEKKSKTIKKENKFHLFLVLQIVHLVMHRYSIPFVAY